MAQENNGAPKPRRWPKFLLVISLGLNLLVMGAVVGAVGGYGGDRRIVLRDVAYGPYTRALSHRDRRAIGMAMRREMGAQSDNISKLRQNYQALLHSLRSEVYDDARVRQLIGEQQEFALRRQNLGQRLLLERLGTMTVGERKQFATGLERALRHIR